MSEMKKHTLESGRVLEIGLAPFANSWLVYQTFLKEISYIELDEEAEVNVNFLKGVFCACMSSKHLEAAIWECMGRCKYDGQKIIRDTFEDVKAREDYIEICWLVAKENVEPFLKTLTQKYGHVLEMMKKSLA